MQDVYKVFCHTVHKIYLLLVRKLGAFLPSATRRQRGRHMYKPPKSFGLLEIGHTVAPACKVSVLSK